MSNEKSRARALKYYHANKVKIAIERRERYLKRTKDKIRKDTLLRRAWKEKSPRIHLWSACKYRAKKEGLDFNLDREDIVIPESCPYLGIKLTSEKGKGKLDNLASVDRINPDLGYIKGNVEVISYKANRMKNDATINELITFSIRVIKRFIQAEDKGYIP